MEWRQKDSVEWLEAELPRARAVFSTRLGGVSESPFDSLNLGILTDDEADAVQANRMKLAAAIGIDPESVAMGLQVHGGSFVFHHEPVGRSHFAHPGAPPDGVDGQLTNRDDLALLVLVADCLPVALSGPGGTAMLHCGWRGLASNLILDAAERIGATHAAVGPGIGPCCFEVGDEVFDAFADYGDDVRNGRNLDLWKISRRALERAGVGSIEVSEVCTYCESDRFYSHRRDHGMTGRQAGITIPAAS